MCSASYLTFAPLLLVALVTAFPTDEELHNEKRIVNGNEAVAHAYPHIASIQELKFRDPWTGEEGWGHHCGGTIIDKYWVLTAAHCLWKKTTEDYAGRPNFRIVLGKHNLVDGNKGTEKIAYPDKFELHRDYSKPIGKTGIRPDDIALIKLKEPVNETDNNNIKYATLVKAQDFWEDDFYDCVVAGWGLTGPRQPTATLKEITVDLSQQCENSDTDGEKFKTYCIYSSEGQSACKGDSGGPMYCGGDILTGVTSGAWCGSFSVYTRVYDYLDWIACVLDGKTNCPQSK